MERMLLKERIPSSLLLYGPSGVGKTTGALIFSKALLCRNPNPWSCGECTSCRYMDRFIKNLREENYEEISVYGEVAGKKVLLYLAGEHPDFMVLVPSPRNIRIDQIRELKEFAFRKPALSEKKVALIDDAHLMNRESANALLKVLEEPPEDTHLILVSEGKESLLPTILSRTVQIEFPPLEEEEFYKLLGEENRDLYELSGGSLTLARAIKEKPEILKIAEDILSSDPERLFLALQEADKLEDKKLLIYILEEKIKKSLLRGDLGYDKFELAMERLREISTALDRGLKLSLALLNLHILLEERS